jgi:hypothetical protein
MISLSLIEPPGWIMADIPVSAANLTASGNKKEASDASTTTFPLFGVFLNV